MSLRKRGGTWWIDVIAPNGERIRRTAGTANKALAQEFHDRTKAELWRITKLGEKPRRTWNEAVVRWLKEQSHKATIDTDKMHLRWLDEHLGGKHLDFISRGLIDHITEVRLAEGVANATVNRLLEVLRAILRKCVNQWEWLDRAPQVRMLKESSRRVRFLTRDEARKLLAVADSFGGYGGILAHDWTTASECHRLAVDAGGFGAATGMDSPGPSESAESNRSAAQRRSRGDYLSAGREAHDARVLLSWETRASSQYEGLVPSA